MHHYEVHNTVANNNDCLMAFICDNPGEPGRPLSVTTRVSRDGLYL